MIAHGCTCRTGCWSEFIKDFGIGFLRRVAQEIAWAGDL
jgi:hypothetical protein